MKLRFRREFTTPVAVIATFFIAAPPAAIAQPATCDKLKHDGRGYVVCTFDPARDSIRTFWQDGTGKAYGGFSALADDLARRAEKLVFAMNAGMYHKDLSPAGLYVEAGRELHKANTRSGPGNFHMKPNGVFYVGPGQAGVMETGRFLKARPAANYATQSGPMLVIDGKIHPRIRETGESEKVRNGVGACGERIVFAISDDAITFFEFASLFRDKLDCRNALFLDGSVSSLYAPSFGRKDWLMPMGPIVGVVRPAK